MSFKRLFFYKLPAFIFILLLSGTATLVADVQTKLSQVAYVAGVRPNQLVGYGLVVGLAGTGDSKSTMSKESIRNLLSNLGQNVPEGEYHSRNIAAVLITATLPAYHQTGDRVDVTVSSIGDAKSLTGGLLIQSPLQAGDGKVYAVAQGVVSTGSAAKAKRGLRNRGGFTKAVIFGGAIVERKAPAPALNQSAIEIALFKFNFTQLKNIHNALQSRYGAQNVAITEGGRVRVNKQPDKNMMVLIGEIEELQITTVMTAKVVIDEKTGTIVMGNDIAVDSVAISQKGMEIKIGAPQTDSFVYGFAPKNKPEGLAELSASTTVGDVVKALNTIGASTKDIINILRALKVAGAIHAEIEII